ncbi:MAG: WcaF family extracellular polysaccharide biosynthesis acetyltransferase [Pseudomonadota bacterium]
MKLDLFDAAGFNRGAPRWREAMWLVASGLLISTWLPGSVWRIALLRLFGAKIGKCVVIKPHVKVKFPWRLSVGNHCWIGEHTWIDNLADVKIGEHVCISQGAYLCTGSHDWCSEKFDLIVKPIALEPHVWIGAKSTIGPGCQVGEGAVVALGSVALGSLKPWTIYSGVPATPEKRRTRSHTKAIEAEND